MSDRETAVQNLKSLRKPVTPQTVEAELERMARANAFHRSLKPGWSTVGAR